ncbi:hypothetical protein ACFFGR_08740 [Arthrobacter liuii]|uniref:Uncharacterized protein n=1 Tax=Arthrobacter liuii TaxID=1476996 RepID=A0ABQ2AX58_9MICC|nr:hypothetical protein [Arthrobacter liuii]GGH97612.1 hypothetical protein GCM10007170_28260 [Arthrobacter liuii]
MSEVPAWIQAITSIFTLFAAIAAGIYAAKAAGHTQRQANAADDQVKVAKEALDITRSQAAVVEEHGEHQMRISLESLDVARQEADRQVQEAQAAYRRYEESRLDAVIPVVLATVRRPGWFIGMKEMYAPGRWTDNWEPISQVQHIEDSQGDVIKFQIRLDVVIENLSSSQTARVDIIKDGNGDVIDLPRGEPLVLRPLEVRALAWTRNLTPATLATEDGINDPKNSCFDLTMWVRDLGMNVRDTYQFSSDLRLFSRDGSRLVVTPVPAHDWTENVAQPLPERFYERLDRRKITSDLSGSGTVTSEIQKDRA